MELSEISKLISPTLSRQLFMMAKKFDDVIDFTIGDPDLPTHDKICEAAYKATIEGKTHYAPNAGLQPLRKLIANYTSSHIPYTFDDDNVAVTFGATEAIYLTFMALLNPEDEVIILAPYWVQYENIVKLLGAKPVVIDSFVKDFEPSIDSIKNAITNKTRAIIVNSPNNPSGFVYSESFMSAIGNLATLNNLYIFADEVYKTLLYQTDKYTSIAKFCPKELLVIFNSFSKMFAMTGWRVGFVVAEKELIDAVVKLQQNVAVCVSTPSQYAAIEAMENAEFYTSLIRKTFSERREVLCNALNRCNELNYIQPEGSFYAFIDISKTGLDSQTFCFSLLEKEHVAVIPGLAFGKAFDNYVRLAYTLENEKIIEGVKRIKEFLNEL